MEDAAHLSAFSTQWSRAEGGGRRILCWEQVPGDTEGQGPAGRMGQRWLATCTKGQYVAQGALGRNCLWLARRLQGTMEEEGERLGAAVRDGAAQGGSFTQVASFGLRRACEDSPHFKGLTYFF